MLLSLLLMQSASAGQKAQSGTSTVAGPSAGAAVLLRMDAVDVTRPILISLESLEGMKLAFQTKGTVEARFTLHEERLGRDLRPQRGVCKLTGTSPHVTGYRWGGGNLTPCLYRMDLFGQDAMYWQKNLGKPAEGKFTRLDFEPPGLKLRPEFCVISAGLEDLHPKPWPEDARLAPEDRKKTVDNVLAMVRLCEEQGTVPIVATLTPFGHGAPKDSPEEKLSDELAALCKANEIPLARVFDLFRKAQEAGEDYKRLMTAMGTTDVRTNAMWPRGYEFDPYTPSFELGITRRFIAVKETLDQVMFVLLDRPD